jgi:aspartate-semialdehyde dehydrogenase
MPRAVIAGASSLLGRELAEELNRAASSMWDLVLADAESAGQMTAAGEEALVIQPLTPESFTGASIVFFAGEEETTLEYWKQALGAGASIVDLTGALSRQPGVKVRAPQLAEGPRLDLTTEAVVSAHPVTLMLGHVSVALQKSFADKVSISSTVLLPASEYGKTAMDELHAQTVALLSFQSLPKEVFDAQVAFNLHAALGASSQASVEKVSARVAAELKSLVATGNGTFQCLQAPVFHGCAASIGLRFTEPVEMAAVSAALGHATALTLAEDGDVSPSNTTTEEGTPMQGSLRQDALDPGKSLWLWLVADNLRLQARNAVYCAGELLAIRPDGTVQ